MKGNTTSCSNSHTTVINYTQNVIQNSPVKFNSICIRYYFRSSTWFSTWQMWWSLTLHSPSTWQKKMGIEWHSTSTNWRVQESLWLIHIIFLLNLGSLCSSLEGSVRWLYSTDIRIHVYVSIHTNSVLKWKGVQVGIKQGLHYFV
jgi:hypothetical protein